jgi:hypothetical protein
MVAAIKTVKMNGKWYSAETTKATAELLEKIKKTPVM